MHLDDVGFQEDGEILNKFVAEYFLSAEFFNFLFEFRRYVFFKAEANIVLVILEHSRKILSDLILVVFRQPAIVLDWLELRYA